MSQNEEQRQSVPKLRADADVLLELTDMAFKNLFLTCVLSTIGILFATAALARLYDDVFLWWLTFAGVLFGSARSGMVYALERNADLRVLFCARGYLRWIYGTVLVLYYSTVAVSTLRNFALHRRTGEILCMTGIFILCLGISGRVGKNPRSSIVIGLGLLSVLAYATWSQADVVSVMGTLLIALFCIVYVQMICSKHELVVELIRAKRTLRGLAERDTLTGLANRRFFDAKLDALCHSGQIFAVLFIDLDRFKLVNDTYGHAAGDALLQAVAERLLATVRLGDDVVARLGGDEFAILQVPIVNAHDAEALALRITETLTETFEIEGHEISAGASLGVVVAEEAYHRSAAELLGYADEALYRAKDGGRGRFVRAEPVSNIV
jgi:diguanylate cyclase (GGDEF)-like protein